MLLELNEGIARLSQRMADGNLIVFAGSGMSVDSGLPDWDGFLRAFIEMASALPLASAQKNQLSELLEEILKLPSNEPIPDPIRVATVIKRKLAEIKLSEHALANAKYNNWFNHFFSSAKPNIKHKLIVTTDYPFFLTTNYDLLLEVAASHAGMNELSGDSFTFAESTKIISFISRKKACVIHVHGAIGRQLAMEEIVFTADDYNKIIKQKHEGFSLALRILFTTYSTLFVGYGASDPHLEDISEDLARYYPPTDKEEEDYPLPRSFLVVIRKKASKVMEQWKSRLRTDVIVIDSYDQYENILASLQKIRPRMPTDSNQLTFHM